MPDSAGQHFITRQDNNLNRPSTSRTKRPHNEFPQVRSRNVTGYISTVTEFSRSHAQKSIQSPVAVSANIISQCVLPRATQIDGPAEDLQMVECFARLQELHVLCMSSVQHL
jgi:hypothetical protein